MLPIHAALLPSGKVLYFSGSQHWEPPSSTDATRLWDPGTGADQYVRSPDVDLFCAGHCLLPNGDLLVAGGTLYYSKDRPEGFHRFRDRQNEHFWGTPTCFVFDWREERWRRRPDMGPGPEYGRWYPTCVTLHDGRVLTISGHTGGGTAEHENKALQLYDPGSGTWTEPIHTSPPLQDTGFFQIRKLFVSISVYPFYYYPRLHVLPDRQVFSSTGLQVDGERMTRTLNPIDGALTTLGDPPPGVKDPHEAGPWQRVYARGAFASTMLPLMPPDYGVKILICGEQHPRVFDLANPELGWQSAGGPRPYELRAYVNAVLLPDATVLLVGGAKSEKVPVLICVGCDSHGGGDGDAIHFAERYHPDSGEWDVLSAPHYDPIARVYHSVALLLPDGRVWIAGSNHDSARNNEDGVNADHPHKGDARELRMELYSPPYLFDGRDAAGNLIPAIRPTILGVQPGAQYGQQFTIQTTDATDIGAVAVLRCSSVTHSFNSDQRYVGLVIDQAKRTSTSLTVTAPPSPDIAPPGYYLLFVLNGAGTPSEGRFLSLHAGSLLLTNVEPSPLPAGQSISVTVHARDADTGEPVAGSVTIDGRTVGSTGSPFIYAFGSSHPQGTVSAPGYPPAPIVWPPLRASELRAWTVPSTLPLRRPVQVTVHAEDAIVRVPVAGTVRIENPGEAAQEFPTNAPFTFTFRSRVVRRRAPDGATDVEVLYPTIRVSAPGYLDERVPFGRGPARLQISVEPSPLPSGRPISVTVHARDVGSEAPVTGTITVAGQPVGTTGSAFTYTFGASPPQGIVSAPGYADAPIAWPPLRAPRLEVRVEPSPPLLGQPVQVTIHAIDADTQAPVAGTVRVQNPAATAQEFPTNVPFTFTFRRRVVRRRAPDGSWDVDVFYPTGRVSAPPYPTTPVDFGWPNV